MVTIKQIILSLLISLPLISYADNCPKLNLKQKKILQIAKKKYRISIVCIEVEQMPRQVIILGESHNNFSQKRIKIGHQTLEEFPFRGLEGMGNTFSQKSEKWHQKNKSESYDSRIWGLDTGPLISRAILKGITITPKMEIFYDMSFVQMIQQDQIGPLANFQVTVPGQHTKIINKSPSKQTPMNIGLEFGPSLSIWVDYCLDQIDSGDFKGIVTSCEPIIAVRNIRMAYNIKKVFQYFPNQQTMLVVVGAAHITGLKHLLIDGDFKKQPPPKKWYYFLDLFI